MIAWVPWPSTFFKKRTHKPFVPLKDSIQKTVFSSPVIDDEIIKIITKFDQTKSPGHDNIGNNIIKRIAKEISKPLAIVFNLSITTGKVPNQLKCAIKVIPIYKKDDAEIYLNYRPVSVLPSFCLKY